MASATKKPINQKLSNAIKKGKRWKSYELDELIAAAVAKDPY